MSYVLSQEAEGFAAEEYQKVVDLLLQLCGIPAPLNREERRAAFCKKWLEENGAKGVCIDAALNVVYPVHCEGSNRISVFMAHTDTVFPDMDPMPLRREGGRIFCPGVGDDSANAALLMTSIKYIIQHQLKPAGGWLFVMNSGEEGLGNLKGIWQILNDYKGRIAKVCSFDGGCNEICNKAVGSTRYRVSIATEGGHSYAKFGNRNAIAVMSTLISSLYSVKVPTEGTTYNVGMISGGTSVNTIAQNAQMLFEYRSDNRESLAAMERLFDSALETCRLTGVKIQCEVLGRRPCMGDIDIGKQKAMEDRAFDLISHYIGSAPKFKASSTDCNAPFSLGIPAICYGGYVGKGAHTREEWVEEASLKPGLRLVLASILSTLND